MNGLAAVGAPADFGGGNVHGNRFQEIDAGGSQMRDHLRWRRFRIFLEVAARDQVRRNNQPQGFRANAGTIGDDEITKAEKRLVFLPNGNVEKSVGADDEKDAIAMNIIGVAEVTHRVDGIVKLRAAEIFAGFGERRNEVRMFGAGEREHGETVREWGQMLLELVRRTACGDEM